MDSPTREILGQLPTPPVNHWGPSHQSLSPFRSVARMPLDPRSAGFSCPTTWPHWFLLLTFNISSTLCCTNVFHSPLFCIQYNTVMLSDQYLISLISVCLLKAFTPVCIKVVRILAAISSNLGIERPFKWGNSCLRTK